MHGARHIENAIGDLRYGMRTLVKHRGFTFVVVLTLSLGIGVNTAVFSLVHGILLQSLPYAQPDQLVMLGKSNLTRAILVGLQQQLKQTEVAAVSIDKGFTFTGNGQAVRLTGNEISSNMLPMLGSAPKMGRLFSVDDQAPGKDRLVILSYGLWQTKFGGDPKIVGRSIVLNDVPHEVAGVMPQEFAFPSPATQLWVPAEINLSSQTDMWEFGYNIIGRLRSGATMATAHAEFDVAYPQIWKTCPFQLAEWFEKQTGFQSLRDFTVSSTRTTLLDLLGAVALILLIACVNVASLLLSRSSSREKEMAVRTALGASRGRIITQLFTESVLLGAIAGVVGCGLAYLALNALKAVLPANTPRLANATIDGYVLLFSAAISIVSSVIFGLAPALQTSKPDIEQTLRANAQSAGVSRGRRKLSGALVVAEISMAVVLASGAGLLIKNLWKLSHTHTGFSEDHLLFADVTPTNEFCKKHDDCAEFYRTLQERANSLPGVKNSAYTAVVPMESYQGVPLIAQDRPETNKTPHLAWYFHISPGYFRTMEIPLLSGRDFDLSDRKSTLKVAIISKGTAQSLWPGRDPLGKQVRFADVPTTDGPGWATIIGVVDDVRHYKMTPPSSLADVKGDIYFPYTQMPPSGMTMVVSSGGDTAALGRELSATAASVGSEVPVSHFRTVREIVERSESEPRSAMWLFSIFAGLALFLGIVGIYSVLSYSVSQRTREIGIRMAMGASKQQVLLIILRQGTQLILGGVILGIAGTLALTRLISSLLEGVSPSDPITLALVAVVVIAAAMMATCIPSLRATRVNPTVCLKYE